MEAQAAFCSSRKRNFVICLFVDKETNGSYPFANGLNRPIGLPIYATREGVRVAGVKGRREEGGEAEGQGALGKEREPGMGPLGLRN